MGQVGTERNSKTAEFRTGPGRIYGRVRPEILPVQWARQERSGTLIWRIFMNVSLVFRIAAVGILVSVLCQVLKHSGREENAFLTSLAGLLLVLYWLVPYIYELFETVKKLFEL